MMIKRWFLVILLVGLVAILVTGCGSEATDTPQPPTATVEPTAEQAAQPAATAKQSPAGESSKVDVALANIQRLEGVVLATVNGTEITWDDYELVLRQALYSIDRQSGVDWNDPAMLQRLGHLQNEVLKQAVDRKLLEQMAAEQGIAVDPAAVQAEVDREKSQIGQSNLYDDWDAFLQDNGLTEETFEQVIRDTLLLRQFMAAQEVDQQEEQVHIAHIVVSDESTAQEIAAKLQAGEDFAELAAEYSEDDETKDDGGDLGWFSKSKMRTELADPAFSLPPGQFSDMIATQFGYTFILVVEREPRQADSNIIARRQQEALMALLDEFRARAAIEYLVDFDSAE